MGRFEQVEDAPKNEIVVEKAVTPAASADTTSESGLQDTEQLFDSQDELVAHLGSLARNSRQQPAQGKKLFLHKSVSRYKPPRDTLRKYVRKIHSQPCVRLSAGCQFTLAQPLSARPARTFVNPHTGRMDGLSMAAIILLAQGHRPQHEYDEASHVCGEPRCVTAAHLVWEPIDTNVSRVLCHDYGVECTHTPPCLFNTRDETHAAYDRLHAEKCKKRKKLKR